MKSRSSVPIFALLLLMVALPGCGVVGFFRYGVSQAHFGKLRVGHCAPDATVVDLQGEPVALSDHFGGRPLVLVFGSFT